MILNRRSFNVKVSKTEVIHPGLEALDSYSLIHNIK